MVLAVSWVLARFFAARTRACTDEESLPGFGTFASRGVRTCTPAKDKVVGEQIANTKRTMHSIRL